MVSSLCLLTSLVIVFSCFVQSSVGLKGARNLQFGGISISSATTNGEANSIGSLQTGLFTGEPQIGANGQGLTQGTSFGSSSSNSPGFGNSQS